MSAPATAPAPIIVQSAPASGGGSGIPWGLIIIVAVIAGIGYFMYSGANIMSGGLLGAFTGTGGGLIGSLFGDVGGSGGIFGSVLGPMFGSSSSDNSDEY